MSTSESSSSLALAATRVLTNPIVFRHIVDFQAGAPFQLLDFWCSQPLNQFCTIPAVQHKAFVANVATLPTLIAQHGDVNLLELLPKVFFRNRGGGLFSTAPAPSGFWTKLDYTGAVDIAIKRKDPVLLALALQPRQLENVEAVYVQVIRGFSHNDSNSDDLQLLDILHTHVGGQLNLIALRNSIHDLHLFNQHLATVAVLTWLWTHLPTLELSPTLMVTAAVRAGRLDVVECMHEHFPVESWQLPQLHETNSPLQDGYWACVDFLISHRGDSIDSFAKADVELIVREADDDKLRVLHQFRQFKTHIRDLLLTAIKNNDWDTIKRSERLGFLQTTSPVTIEQAGTVEVLQYLVERGLGVVSPKAVDVAVANAQWHIVQYLTQHFSVGDATHAMAAAIGLGDLDRVKFLFENHDSPGCSAAVFRKAVQYSSLPVIEYLIDSVGCECTVAIMNTAVTRADLPILKYLYTRQSVRCDEETVSHVVSLGHVDVIQFLCDHDELDSINSILTKALAKGQLDLVRSLYASHPQVFDGELLESLLIYGAFDVYLSLCEHLQLPADDVIPDTVKRATRDKKLETLKFILQEPLNRMDLGRDAMDTAACSHDLEWIIDVWKIVSSAQCHASAIANFMDLTLNPPKKLPSALKFLISACNDPNAKSIAKSIARTWWNSSIARQIDLWKPTPIDDTVDREHFQFTG